MSKINHRRSASATRRVLAKNCTTRAARRADTKSLRRAAKWINTRSVK